MECDTKQLNVLILGKSLVGKTTLVKRIFGDESGIKDKLKKTIMKKGERTATDGIEMHEWSPQEWRNELMTLRLWDFTGQELFYTTHQFFLSENCITLLLFNLNE